MMEFKIKRIIIKTLIFLLFIPISLFSKVYYVRNIRSFNTAVYHASPGDTIYLKDGIYSDTVFVFKANGTKTSPIKFAAEHKGKAILTGSSRLKIAGNYLVVSGLFFTNGSIGSKHKQVIEFRDRGTEANHCRLTETVIINYGDTTDPDYKWVGIYGTHNRVDHCYFAYKKNPGALLVVWRPHGNSQYHRIDHNYFGPRPPLGKNGGEIIRIGTSKHAFDGFSHCIVEHNLFKECDGEIEIISSKSSSNIFRYNTFIECAGTLTLRHGNDCLVEGNFFLGHNKPKTGGVRIIGSRHKVINNYFEGLRGTRLRSAICIMDGTKSFIRSGYMPVTNAIVAFNTIVNCKDVFNIGNNSKKAKTTVPPQDCVIANNLVYNTDGRDIFSQVDVDKHASFMLEGNIMFNLPLGLPPHTHGITITNPKLIHDGSIWRPNPNKSPCLDASVGTYSFVTNDIDGQPRSDGKKDVGADEKSTAPIVNRILTQQDCGPSWYFSK